MFIYEHFFPPFDEGVKKFSYMSHKELSKTHQVTLIRNYTNLPNIINNLIFIPRIILLSLIKRPEKIVFIPQGALTFPALIKAWLLEKIYKNKMSVIGVQKKTLKEWQYEFIRKIKLNNIFVLSNSMANEIEKLGKTARPIKVGIDRERYTPAKDIAQLRDKYNIPNDKPVLLHVGHIRISRNILWLLEVQQALPEIQVVIIGSTSTQQENEVFSKLSSGGVLVLRDYFSDIQELYQLSNWYCFPVQHEEGAMETPLSVLEGMATNLPIITTPFGCLVDLFTEDDCFRYINSSEEIINTLKSDFGKNCTNRTKTEPFTWQKTIETILN